jgi:hypothetical protein
MASRDSIVPRWLTRRGFCFVVWYNLPINIHGGESMEEKKVFENPEVTTYDRDELDLDIALTGGDASGPA